VHDYPWQPQTEHARLCRAARSSGRPAAQGGSIVIKPPCHRRPRPDGVEDVEVGINARQVLPVFGPGVFNSQCRDDRRSRGRRAQILGCPAHDQHVLAAFQMHHDSWISGQVARLDGAALAVQVQRPRSPRPRPAPRGGTRWHGGAQPVNTRHGKPRGHLGPRHRLVPHLPMMTRIRVR
jgi:hypothetical protein